MIHGVPFLNARVCDAVQQTRDHTIKVVYYNVHRVVFKVCVHVVILSRLSWSRPNTTYSYNDTALAQVYMCVFYVKYTHRIYATRGIYRITCITYRRYHAGRLSWKSALTINSTNPH